jgi:uncharacterized protein (DUF1015 family)
MATGQEGTLSVVRPFRARIVRQECAAQTVSPMFDALQPAERALALDARRGRPCGIDPDAYDESATALFVYRLRRGDAEHVGVVGEVSAEAFVDGRVRGHEAVQPDRVEALVHRFAGAPARSELVALLHRAGPGVAVAVAETLRGQPVIRFLGADGLEQTVWRVPGSVSRALSQELSEAVHYIADGHHRVAASLREWQLAGRPSDAGVLCVIYPLEGLRLLAFHRRVVGPMPASSLLGFLSDEFDVRDIAHPDDATGCFGVYVEGRWFDASYNGVRSPGAAGLDIAVLNDQVLEPLLGVGAQAASRLEIASALTSLTELTQRCDQDGGALFALRPPTLDRLMDVADRGEVMPPKTTYFDPKPYAGIFLR